MRRKRLWTWLLVALFVLMLAAEALAVVKLFYLDMLPPAYLMVLVAVFAVLACTGAISADNVMIVVSMVMMMMMVS